MPTPESSVSAPGNNNSNAKVSDPTGAGTVNVALDAFKEPTPEEPDDYQDNDIVKNSADSVSGSQNIQSFSSLTSSKTDPNILQPDEVSVKALRIIEKPEAYTCLKSAKSGTTAPPTCLQPGNVESSSRFKNVDSGRVVVDTAAPIESVKDAVSKFGGIVDWKTHKVQTLEKCRHIDQELKKTQEDMMVWRKRSQAAEYAKMEVLTELERTKKQIDEQELQLSLWSSGIADKSDEEAEQELEAIVAQHYEDALSELKSLKDDLEAEKTLKELTAELLAAKESLDAVHADYREAEDRRNASIVASEIEIICWEREVKQVEAEVEKLNQEYLYAEDLKSRLDSASALLSSLKTELASYIKSKIEQENADAHSITEAEISKMEFGLTKKELEMVKLRTEKATAEVSFLKVAASSLQSELEKEKEELTAIRERRGIAMVSVESLEAELSMIMSDIALVETKKKETREKSVDLPSKLQQAAEEADQEKSYKQRVLEELQRARNEAEQTKAEACISETRLDAIENEIEATKASEKLAVAAINALHETETAQISDEVDSANVVTISSVEYQTLSKRAQEAEKQAKTMIAAALVQIEEAKKCEAKSLQKLEEVSQRLSANKGAYASATKKSERAINNKLSLEQELRAWRSKNAQRRKASEPAFVITQSVTHSGLSPRRSIKHRKEAKKSGKVVSTEPLHHTPTPNSACVDQSSFEYEDSSPDLKIVKRKKRSLFPRLLMFFAKRKPHVSKKVL